MIDPDCQPSEFPCWQHYGDHHNYQPPTKWVIDLSIALLDFRLRQMKLEPTHDNAWNVYMAGHYLHALHNIRWRFINFEPFIWPVGKSRDTYVPEEDKVKARTLLEQLGFDLKPPPAPIPRRF